MKICFDFLQILNQLSWNRWKNNWTFMSDFDILVIDKNYTIKMKTQKKTLVQHEISWKRKERYWNNVNEEIIDFLLL
jgi:hypothetical protein